MRDGKVDVEGLKLVIKIFKGRDSRRFPLGHKRPERELPLAPKKEKPIIRRRLSQRLEIIARECEAMTDAEQVQLLRLWPSLFLDFFRRQNIEKAAAEQKRVGLG